MKVLTVNNGYPSDANPNFTTYVKTMDECIQESGCHVNNLVIKYDGKITSVRKFLKYLRFWGRCLTSKLEADVIYINHLPFAWPILFNPNLRKKRVIIHWHGNDLVGKSIFLSLIHKVIKRRIDSFEHVVPSEYFRKKLLKSFSLSNPVFISPSGGVDTDSFSPCPNNSQQDQFVIGFASGLIKEKGADLLLGIMKNCHELEESTGRKIVFRVINYGGEAKKYIRLFKETGANVEIVDKMRKSEMPGFFNSISMLLMPSIREGESLGLVVLESMSCGKPALTYDMCAFPEFVISGISGERSKYSPDMKITTKDVIDCLNKLSSNYSSYTPRKVVLEKYSKHTVVNFYENLFHQPKICKEMC